jgi:hypothetical protein
MTKMTQIKNHDVQSIYIQAPPTKVFDFIANPENLPKWTNAFKEADRQSALLSTPNGDLKIGLTTKTNRESGTIDWYLSLPDGSLGTAYSRVVSAPDKRTIYSFILIAPPAPIEKIEGVLVQQMELLRNELQKLRSILEE